jgi:type III pantothenate kinase
MLLCIDTGNTNIVMGLWDDANGDWDARWRVRTAHNKMPDEYAMLLKTLLKDKNYELEDITRVVLACVVPHLKTVLKDLFEQYLGLTPLILGPGVRTGLSLRIDNPAELGADIVADAVAAYERLRTTCIIVDFGTATTFSAVSAKGELLGVSIAPGIEVAAKALSTRTAQLPHINLVPPPRVIGTNTTNSMQSGLIFGYKGLVEELIRRMRDELGGTASVIATGGLSKVFAPLTEYIEIIDLDLTLEGLRIIGERN